MTWEFVSAIVLSGAAIRGWALIINAVRKHEQDVEKLRRARRDVELQALRQIGIDKSRTLDVHA